MSRFEERLARLFGGDQDEYPKALASWQIQRGMNTMDLTPSQTERFRAFEKAGGNLRAANGLLYSRLRYRRGALSDG